MSKNNSENLITSINTNVFYKEFTFDKNDFYPKDGKKELADNIMWLDELLFIIQIKERNLSKAKGSIDSWFKSKVLGKAKKQIKDTLKYLRQYDSIPIGNKRNQFIDIAKVDSFGINKLIIYQSDDTLSEENKNIKFYESKDVGYIHIFSLEDYFWICKYLVNPAELDEYLKFRERIYSKHKEIINVFPEQYILSHFINTNDETHIEPKYIETLSKLKKDSENFDMSHIIENFREKIRVESQYNSVEYHAIIKEIAKLKRYELLEYKKRFLLIMEDVNKNEIHPPRRFTSERTGCGFVFISLTKEQIQNWQNGLQNFTLIYKYKRKLKKCLGVIVFKVGNFYDFNWAYIEDDWKYNKELEVMVEREKEFYKQSSRVEIDRYKFE